MHVYNGGNGPENLVSLPLLPSSREMSIILDNAEFLLDTEGANANKI